MKPELNEGEIYVGRINDQHIILLPGDNDDNASWEEQMEWATSLGGDLPNRIEQSMLWANHRDQFQKDWYWSNETHHSESGWAWGQDFDNGDQSYDHKASYNCRARAVRRVTIGDAHATN